MPSVGWGGHRDIPGVGNLDWLFEGRAGLDQWTEGIVVLAQEQQQKQKL